MIKKIVAYLLCLSIAQASILPVFAASSAEISVIASQGSEQITAEKITQADILKQYPNAKFIHIEADEYPQLAENLRQQGYVEGHQTQPNHALQTSSDCNDEGSNGGGGGSGGSGSTSIHFGDHVSQPSHGDDAIVLFVIIGMVVIVVWSFYAIKYLYDVATGFSPCGRWSELDFSSSAVLSARSQQINFNGLRYTAGFRDDGTDVGFALEVGHSDILLYEFGALSLQGTYWLLGPVLRWRLSRGHNPHLFQMEFLGGSTEHSEMGLIAKASVGLRFGIGENAHIGFDWGAMNINLKNTQGIITERDQYYYLYGFNMGFKF